MGPAGAEALAEALPRLPVLQHLNLACNHLGSKCAGALADAWKRVPSMALQHLHLRGNRVGNVEEELLRAAPPGCRIQC